MSGGFLGAVLHSRPGAGSPSPIPRLLSGHMHSHVALSPGTLSSSRAGRLLSQVCCGKSLELGPGKDQVISACRRLREERCGCGAEGDSRLDCQSSASLRLCLYGQGQMEDWAEVPLGSLGEKLQLLPLPCFPASKSFPEQHVRPSKACLRLLSIHALGSKAASWKV